MRKDTNPLQHMTDAIDYDNYQEERPNSSFKDTALPGFKQALQARRAIREFDGTPIPEEIMRDILSDAILAPSSSNLQTYELYWIKDVQKRKEVAYACLGQPAAMTAGELVVIVARGDLWQQNRKKLLNIMTDHGVKTLAKPIDEYYNKIVPLVMRNDPFGINNFVRSLIFWFKGRNEPFMRTPVNQCDHRIYPHIQASLVAQTLMLSFSAHGYESCPIGGMDKLRIAKILNLTRKAEVTMVISAGCGKPEGIYGPRVRLPKEDLIKEV